MSKAAIMAVMVFVLVWLLLKLYEICERMWLRRRYPEAFEERPAPVATSPSVTFTIVSKINVDDSSAVRKALHQKMNGK